MIENIEKKKRNDNKKVESCENNKVLIEYLEFLLKKLDSISKHVGDELCGEIKKLSLTKRKYLNDIKVIDLDTIKNEKILLLHLNQLNQMSLFELQHLLTIKDFKRQIRKLKTIEDLDVYIKDFHTAQRNMRFHLNTLMSYLNSDLINYVDFIVKKNEYFSGSERKKKLKKYAGSLFLEEDEKALSQSIETKYYFNDFIYLLNYIKGIENVQLNTKTRHLLFLLKETNQLRNGVIHKPIILDKDNIRTFYLVHDIFLKYLYKFLGSSKEDMEIIRLRKKDFLKTIKTEVSNEDLQSFIRNNFKRKVIVRCRKTASKYEDNDEQILLIEKNINLYFRYSSTKFAKSNRNVTPFLFQVYSFSMNAINYLFQSVYEILLFTGDDQNKWNNNLNYLNLTAKFKNMIKNDDQILNLLFQKFSFFPLRTNTPTKNRELIINNWTIIFNYRKTASHDFLKFNHDDFKEFIEALNFFIPHSREIDLAGGEKLLLNINKNFVNLRDLWQDEDKLLIIAIFDEDFYQKNKL